MSVMARGNVGAGFAILRGRSAGALIGMAVFVAETVAFASVNPNNGDALATITEIWVHWPALGTVIRCQAIPGLRVK